jgi:transposase
MVRAGQRPEALAKKFEPSAQTIRNWVRQADLDDGKRTDGLTSEEREELVRLRRENRALREEREILKKPRPGSPRRATRTRRSVRVHESQPGHARGADDVPSTGGLAERVLRLA